MKFYYKCLVFLLAMIGFGCEDFLEVNENPNSPSISTPSLTLPVAQQGLVQLNATNMTYLGQFMVYNWSTPSNWSANEDLIRYRVTTTFFNTIFETSYLSIFKNLNYIENYEDPLGVADYTLYDAIAQTLRGFQYQYLVDLYGDVPYFEANLRSENITPAYNDAEEIYKDVIDQLTNAANLALNLPDDAENPEEQDIIFGGNANRWAQFANTIKLRMLMRLSDADQDSFIQEQITLIDANGAGYITADVVANPGYSDTDEKQNPFYGYVGLGPNGVEIDRNDFTVATDYSINYLSGTNDPRLGRIYEEGNAGFKGAPQTTILPGSGFTSRDLSQVGPGLLESSEQDQPIMLYAEAEFLLAEAALRGYIAGGEMAAKSFYEAGIEESFRFLGVEDDEMETVLNSYLNQNLANVSWDNSPNKLEAIITQKWIALNGTSSIESWIELTRTGYPSGLPVPSESGGTRPVRLLYPATEVARNANNVPRQSVETAFTQPPFWKQ